MNELDKVVDKFIVIESAHMHSGESKPHYLKNNLNKLSKFANK